MKRTVGGVLRGALRPFARLAVQASPYVTGKVLPLAAHGNSVAIPRRSPETVPPVELFAEYGSDEADYLESGRRDMATLLGGIEKHGIERPRTVLDLGCAAGRMLRHYPRAAGAELWGADISARHIVWCQQNLPEMNFLTVSTAPHLPFEDGYFDLVYCASVFTHITDLADAWLLEIRRVLRPGGLAYITIHDGISYERLRTDPAIDLPQMRRMLMRFEARYVASKKPYEMFAIGADPFVQVFYDRDYVTSKWSKWMRLVAYEPQAHDYQSAMLLQKRAGSAPT